MPFVLRKHGVPVDRIAEIVAIATVPAVWYFIYSPVVDFGLRRKTWFLIGATGAGLCCAVATLLSGKSLTVLTALLFLGSCASSLISTTNGTLLSRLSPTMRGRASGWLNAGNLGGGALGGGVALWIAGMVSLPWLSIAVFFLVAAPVIGAPVIQETLLANRSQSGPRSIKASSGPCWGISVPYSGRLAR